MERLADLDELTLRCRTDLSKSYLAESVAAYRAGAYRASIVAAWVAVVFDFIDKIRELSLTGSAVAKQLLDEFERFQSHLDKGDKTVLDAALKFERGILETARDKLELIDYQQFVDLDRLREDRNRCAHPTYQRIEIPYRPSPELVRTHIHNAVAHVLSQRPLQGKAALDELMGLVRSEFFPTDQEKAKVQLLASALARPSEALFRSFLDSLVYGFFGTDKGFRLKRTTMTALQACLEIDRGRSEARIPNQLDKIARTIEDKDFVAFVALAAHLSGVWPLLEVSTREKVANFAAKAEPKDLIRVLPYLARNSDLGPAVLKRVAGFNPDDLSGAIERWPERELTSPAVEAFCKAGSWPVANAIYQNSIRPLLTKLSSIQVEKIIRSSKEAGNDLLGSNGFASFVEAAYEHQLMGQKTLDALLDSLDLEKYKPSPEEGDDDDTPPF
jgi:hypothetical protein